MLAIVCGPRQPRKRCSVPGCNEWSTAACDYPVVRKGKPGTCDARLCDRCRQRQGPDRDYCSPHMKTPPIPGDARIHVSTGRVLYVVAVNDHEGSKHVTFSTSSGGCGVRQTVEIEKWNAKTRGL
jgi:hypothetical protein